MTAGTVVITGGILATVILLCIIAVLCYCRLQVSTVGLWSEAGGLGGTHRQATSPRWGQKLEAHFGGNNAQSHRIWI